MSEAVVKEGLSEKAKIGGLTKDHERTEPNFVPKKSEEKAKKGGKSFTIK